MKKIFTLICISVSLLCSAATPVLRFRQYSERRPDGLVRYCEPPAAMRCDAPLKVSTEGHPEFVANCIISNPGYGMYSFKSVENAGLNRLAETPAFEGGAVYVNGKYYACAYDYDESFSLTMMKWYTYDALTWTLLSERDNPLDFSYIATDRTYDQSTGKVYSISYDKTGQSIWLSTTDVKTGAPTMIAPLEKDVITIAANKKGELYGIDTNANLYKINSADASLTLVGNTGIYEEYMSDYTQSITFDTRTDKLYWAEFHTEGWFDAVSAIYEVDTKSGKALKVADLPGNPELVGLYVNRYATAGVPDEVSALKANPNSDDATKFTFSFTTPALTVDGNPIPSDEILDVEISVDGDLIDLLNASPNSNVTTSERTFTAGLHTLRVVVSNSVGQGVTTGLSFYSGYDVPAAPTDVRLTATGMEAKLTWKAPTAGANGGIIRQPVTYTVTRMPGNVTVASGLKACSFSETLAEPAKYTYSVSAVSADGAGPSAESNPMVIALYNAPYECGFDTQAEFDLFSIANLSESIKVWNYDETQKCARHSWDLTYATDDWLVSPAVKLDPAYTYEVSFDAWQMVDTYPEHFELWYGTSPDTESMTKLLDTGQLSGASKKYSSLVSPLANGPHYIAIRGNNPRNGMMSYADNLRIVAKGSSNVPAPVSNFKLTAADNGGSAVTVEFDAPTKLMNGEPIESITAIDIIRGVGDEPIKTISAPAKGEHISWTDNSVTTGTFTYRALVRTAQGVSQPVSATVYVGVDEPCAPTDVKAEQVNGGYMITWQAPASGVNGGNLNGLLTYRVNRVVNNDSEVIGSEIGETAFTDEWMPGAQASAYYTVIAVTSAGESEAVATDRFEVGEAYELPYAESFADAVAMTNPWGVQNVVGTSGSWTLCNSGENPYIGAHDSDDGLATFDGYHSWANGMELRLISPRIDISKYVDPTLTFHMYHYNGSAGWWQEEPDPVNEWLQVEISTDGSEFMPLPDAKFDSYAATSDWQKHTLSLDDYNTAHEVRIAFRGHGAGCANIHIDDIEVKGTIGLGGVSQIDNTQPHVVAEAGAIRFVGLTSPLHVYDMAGVMVASSRCAEGYVTLPAGIYLARTGDMALRLLVK